MFHGVSRTSTLGENQIQHTEVRFERLELLLIARVNEVLRPNTHSRGPNTLPVNVLAVRAPRAGEVGVSVDRGCQLNESVGVVARVWQFGRPDNLRVETQVATNCGQQIEVEVDQH